MPIFRRLSRPPTPFERSRKAMREVDLKVRSAFDEAAHARARAQESLARKQCKPWPSPIDVSAGRDTEAPTEREQAK